MSDMFDIFKRPDDTGRTCSIRDFFRRLHIARTITSLNQVAENWNAELPIMQEMPEITDNSCFDVKRGFCRSVDRQRPDNAMLPPLPAIDPKHLPLNTHDYHTTIIGFVAAAEAPPV